MSFLFRIAFIVLLLVANSVHGQSSILFSGGINFATRGYEKNGTYKSSEYGWVTGANAGVTYQYSFNEMLSIASGIQLNSRGYDSYAKITYINNYNDPPITENYRLTYKHNFLYADIPVLLRINYEIAREAYVFGRIGPYFGYTLAGNRTQIGILADSTGIYFSPSQPRYNLKELSEPRLDFGANVSFGVEIQQFFFEASYSAGLRNMANTEYYKDLKSPNKAVMLCLGYRMIIGE